MGGEKKIEEVMEGEWWIEVECDEKREDLRMRKRYVDEKKKRIDEEMEKIEEWKKEGEEK